MLVTPLCKLRATCIHHGIDFGLLLVVVHQTYLLSTSVEDGAVSVLMLAAAVACLVGSAASVATDLALLA